MIERREFTVESRRDEIARSCSLFGGIEPTNVDPLPIHSNAGSKFPVIRLCNTLETRGRVASEAFVLPIIRRSACSEVDGAIVHGVSIHVVDLETSERMPGDEMVESDTDLLPLPTAVIDSGRYATTPGVLFDEPSVFTYDGRHRGINERRPFLPFKVDLGGVTIDDDCVRLKFLKRHVISPHALIMARTNAISRGN